VNEPKPSSGAIRVAYVCADRGVPVFGSKGSSVHVQEILRALGRRGAAVTLLTPRADAPVPASLKAIRVRSLPLVSKVAGADAERAALDLNQDLLASLRREGPFDLVYERYSLWSFAAMEYARETEVPGVLEVNAPLIDEQAQYRQLFDRASAETVASRAFAAATVMVAVSEEVARYLKLRSAAEKEIRVVFNGVDTERFRPGLEPSRPAAPEIFTVGFVSSLKLWHGLDVLAAAFDLLTRSSRKVRLLVIGDGPGRAALVEDLGRRGLLDLAEFTGAVEPGEVPALLASVDAAAAPYPGLAGFYFSPLKVFEYMAAGLAVAASRIGQVDGVIRDGVSGLLCPPGDAAALAQALDRLRRDPELRAGLGRAARATVLERHTWDAVLDSSLQGLLPAVLTGGVKWYAA